MAKARYAYPKPLQENYIRKFNSKTIMRVGVREKPDIWRSEREDSVASFFLPAELSEVGCADGHADAEKPKKTTCAHAPGRARTEVEHMDARTPMHTRTRSRTRT